MQDQPREDRTDPRIPPPLGIVRQPTQHDPRLDSKILSAVGRIAPGTELRAAIDDIIRSSEGALIVIGEPNELAFLLSGGIKLDVPFTPQLLYELTKMDGAVLVNSAVTKLSHANVQLMPDPTIPSAETGTRHRTAERVARQTDALVISISQQRETVTVFVGQSRYQLETIADVLAKTNQALSTLETYRARLEQVVTRLTALEFQNAVMLDDVLVTLQRAELTTRMAEEIERACVELGEEGRLIRMQLEELVADVPDEKAALVYDYHAEGRPRTHGRGARRAGGASVQPATRVRAPGGARVSGVDQLHGLLGHPARVPRAVAHPAPSGRRRQTRGREPRRARRGCQRLSAGAGSGGRCRRRSGPGDPGRAQATPRAQSGRSVLAVVALSRDFLEKVAVSSSFSYTGAVQPAVFSSPASLRKRQYTRGGSGCTESATRWCIRTTVRERSSRRRRAKCWVRSAST